MSSRVAVKEHPLTLKQQIKETISLIIPIDVKENEDLAFTKNWIDSGAEIFRISKPATPDPHLVAYFLLFDPATKKVLLVDHKNAGLWLPTGGHVERNEHPQATVKREIMEELNIQADFLLEDPFFLTVSKPVGKTITHTDVSLWYLLKGCSNTQYVFDLREFHQIAWFSQSEIPYECSNPHLQRCIQKLKAIQLL